MSVTLYQMENTKQNMEVTCTGQENLSSTEAERYRERVVHRERCRRSVNRTGNSLDVLAQPFALFSSHGLARVKSEALSLPFLTFWDMRYAENPIQLLKELDTAELFYSGVTRKMHSSEEFRYKLSFLLEKIISAHKKMSDSWRSVFSSDSVIQFALLEYAMMDEGIRDSDPVLSISMEKYFKILTGTGAFYSFKDAEKYLPFMY